MATIHNTTDYEYNKEFVSNQYMLSEKNYLNTIIAYRVSYDYWQITRPMLQNLKNSILEYLSDQDKIATIMLELDLSQSFKSSKVNATSEVSGKQ